MGKSVDVYEEAEEEPEEEEEEEEEDDEPKDSKKEPEEGESLNGFPLNYTRISSH